MAVWCAVLCPRYMKVPGVSARFGTDPFIWNWAMWLVARLCPRQFLQDRSQVCIRFFCQDCRTHRVLAVLIVL